MLKTTGFITAQVGQVGLVGKREKPINLDYKQFNKNYDFNNPSKPVVDLMIEYINYCADGKQTLHDIKNVVDALCQQYPLEEENGGNEGGEIKGG